MASAPLARNGMSRGRADSTPTSGDARPHHRSQSVRLGEKPPRRSPRGTRDHQRDRLAAAEHVGRIVTVFSHTAGGWVEAEVVGVAERNTICVEYEVGSCCWCRKTLHLNSDRLMMPAGVARVSDSFGNARDPRARSPSIPPKNHCRSTSSRQSYERRQTLTPEALVARARAVSTMSTEELAAHVGSVDGRVPAEEYRKAARAVLAGAASGQVTTDFCERAAQDGQSLSAAGRRRMMRQLRELPVAGEPKRQTRRVRLGQEESSTSSHCSEKDPEVFVPEVGVLVGGMLLGIGAMPFAGPAIANGLDEMNDWWQRQQWGESGSSSDS